MRLHNGVACAGLLWLGRGTPSPNHFREAAAIVAMVLLSAAAHMANDLFDRSADAYNRPGRPLPAGRIGVARLRRSLAATWSAGLGLGILALPAWTGWWILWAVSGPGYSLWAKGQGWRAPVWTAAAITSCWVAGALERGFGQIDAVATLLLVLFLVLRELVKGREDLPGDLLAGYRQPSRRATGVEIHLLGGLLLGAGLCLVVLGPGASLRVAAGLFVACLLAGLWWQDRPAARDRHRAGTVLKFGAFAGLSILWSVPAG